MPQNLASPEQYQHIGQVGLTQSILNPANALMQQAFDFPPSMVFGDAGTSRALWSDPERGANLPMDVPAYQFNDMADPFQGFDIPFWLGQDNYAGWLGESV